MHQSNACRRRGRAGPTQAFFNTLLFQLDPQELPESPSFLCSDGHCPRSLLSVSPSASGVWASCERLNQSPCFCSRPFKQLVPPTPWLSYLQPPKRPSLAPQPSRQRSNTLKEPPGPFFIEWLPPDTPHTSLVPPHLCPRYTSFLMVIPQLYPRLCLKGPCSPDFLVSPHFSPHILLQATLQFISSSSGQVHFARLS